MNDTVIQVANVSKRYRLGVVGTGTLAHDLNRWWARVRGRPDPTLKVGQPIADSRQLPVGGQRLPSSDYMWALKDLSFEVHQGEILGIIGSNGAGKSTVLKILSRVTAPTSGVVRVRGRVASLLEVGTGFHPELTGRENILLNGAILGMRKAETARKFDEIVAFSGVEQYIDTPVKRYSSGMYVRLAFAVAAHLEPEILIVDEVLAVGDAAFQKKCLGKMGDVAHEGRTVLFVSHNMAAVQALCGRTIWIDQGQIVEEGLSGNVVSNYLRTSSSVSSERVWPDVNTAPGNDQVRLRRACVRPQNGAAGDPITIKTPLLMEFEYWNLAPNERLDLSLEIYNEQRVFVIHTAPASESVWYGQPLPVGLFRSVCYIPGSLLNDGTLSATLMIVRDEAEVVLTREDVLTFAVTDDTDHVSYRKWLGAVRPDLKWSTELVDARASVLQRRRSP